jgi:hypothetical protein
MDAIVVCCIYLTNMIARGRRYSWLVVGPCCWLAAATAGEEETTRQKRKLKEKRFGFIIGRAIGRKCVWDGGFEIASRKSECNAMPLMGHVV